MRIDRAGAIDLTGGSGQLLVIGVARQVEQQERGEDRTGALLGLAIGLVDAQCAQNPPALDESVRRRTVDPSENGRSVPRLGERERIIGEGIGVRVVSDDEPGNGQSGRGVLGRRCRRRREQCGDGFDVRASLGSEHGGPGSHRVTDSGEFLRMHADVACAQAHAGHDVEHSAQVGGESAVRRYGATLAVRCRHDESPGRQVLQRLGVIAGSEHPAVRERHPGQAEALGRGVDDAGLPGQGKIASEHLVRATLGESRCQLLRFRHERRRYRTRAGEGYGDTWTRANGSCTPSRVP